ncbi:MAG: bis(5'-nucleosyl)-tetraphosphatase (symmetrical) YqeK [Clostridia bacterium]|jgi:predicted HD superfamily hydrolase involved in NAD metabolism
MLSREEILGRLTELLPEKRYIHSLGVERTAVELAERFGADIQKASTAALVHDCAKAFSKEELLRLSRQYGLEIDPYYIEEPELIHGALGAEIARERFEIQDKEILSAIAYHTTGKKNMTLLEKIIYLADLIEPGRDYPGVQEIRVKAMSDLDEALLAAFQSVISYVLANRNVLHPRTIYAWNDLLKEWKKSCKRSTAEKDEPLSADS